MKKMENSEIAALLEPFLKEKNISITAPFKVSEENGQIQVGDRLTTSKTLPGYAMKMTDSSQSIGIALESFDSNSCLV